MINNQKCEMCGIYDICKAAAKLKPFTGDARTDLGVTLTFEKCDNFVDANVDGEVDPGEE